MRAFRKMFTTELKLSIRGMDMVIFSIIMPVVVLVILGVVFKDKAASDNADYSFFEQSFGAVCAIAICAGGVMGLPLVVSDYRSKKILKRYKVTPIRPIMILSVQILIYALYAVTSLVSLLILASLAFDYQMRGSIIVFLGSYLLVMISMFSIGMLVGGLAKNVKTAGLMASILYFPMLVFSGATLPYELMPRPMQIASDFMPLTQGIKLLKASSLGHSVSNVLSPIIILMLLAILCSGISIKYFKWE